MLRNWKVNLIFVAFSLFGLLIVGRLVQLQIIQGAYYEALALGQQAVFDQTFIKRGGIFLNNKTCLAQSQEVFFAYLSGEKIAPANLEKEAEVLENIFAKTKDELIELSRNGKLLKNSITFQQAQQIREKGLAGLWMEKVSARNYPQANFASQVIGFVNNEGNGQYGVEKFYDDDLADFSNDIFLSLDYNIQYFAEKLLNKANETWQIASGQIIVQDPTSGKIMAMAHFPNFDCNNYGKENDLGIFINSAAQKLFEPGSVFKPLVMAAAIEEGIVAPETKYIDSGVANVGGKDILNFEKRIWGEQTMIDVLEESINTGMVFVEQKMGSDIFWRYIKNFGLLEKTDIDLPGEVSSANNSLKNGIPRDFAVASFGQGIQITPLQMMRAFSALANNGKMTRPYIVEKIVKSNGDIEIKEPQGQKQVISEQTAAKITAMLVSVTRNGSGRLAAVPGYYIAGKTGTAQVPIQSGGYSDNQTIQSFIGYFPAFKPQYLILVKLDNPRGIGSAGHSATPIFRELAKYIIDLKQIPPSPDLVNNSPWNLFWICYIENVF